jgi:hypothetical protein
MPFDPAKPATNSPNSSAEMRAQLNALKDEIDDKPTTAQVNDAVAGAITTATTNAAANSSANTNSVGLLGFTVSDPPTQSEMQQVLEKLNEFINAARGEYGGTRPLPGASAPALRAAFGWRSRSDDV